MAYSCSFRSHSLPDFPDPVWISALNCNPLFRLPRLFFCLLLVPAMAWAEPVPEKIQSRFGVSFYLPDDWRLLTSEELTAVDDADAEQPMDLPPAMRERLSRQVKDGSLELIFNAREARKGVYDNITLFETRDQVPEAAAQIRSTCGALPGLLSRTLGRPVLLEQCRGTSLAGYPAFVLAYAGSPEETRILQYMVQLEQNRSLVMTLTYQQQNAQTLDDFQHLLERLEIN